MDGVLKGKSRVLSIDILRGLVMIIMALDHVRDYFHGSAFLYDPTDLSRTSVALFFTRFATHYCAPIFVFLSGVSAYLSGITKSRNELSAFLFKRGLWLVFAELFIITLAYTFNPSYPYLKFQVIWAIGVSMMALGLISRMNRTWIGITGAVLILGHNLLDNIHIAGNGFPAFLWSALHEPANFKIGNTQLMMLYPVLPWIGIMALGFWLGRFYAVDFDADQRRRILKTFGVSALVLFALLRIGNFYGDPSPWTSQKNFLWDCLSFVNVTKYPPSLLYSLITLGPALLFLSYFDNRLKDEWAVVRVFGRVPMFYYLIHILCIHLLAMVAVVISGYSWHEMILTTRVNSAPGLKGYGFNLITVYAVWIGLIFFLYPLCKWFDGYKRDHIKAQPWLSYF